MRLVGPVQVLPPRFALSDKHAWPEEVNKPRLSTGLFHNGLKRGYPPAAYAEYVQKLVPEGLCLGPLAARVLISFQARGTWGAAEK